ncbi:phosphoglycolate phosphatase [Palleronia sp. KMU-117]|uniref:phosphoglycolate phosphatase n=1 Tax=Palleronia sp. KMU-117 TaxID=3434108 RepID=UPI003D716651
MPPPIVFDLDGTLVDSLPGIALAANTLLAGEGLAPLPERRIGGFVGHGERVFLQRLIAAAGLPEDAFDRLLPRFMSIYVEASRETRLFPHVAEVLDAFAARGVGLGLCSNKPSGPLEAVLDAAGLRGVFAIVVAGDSLPQRKPDPAPLLHALARLPGQGGLYVGDSPVDAETAQRAGVPFALFTEGIREVPVDEIPHDRAFADMRNLPAIYVALTAG